MNHLLWTIALIATWAFMIIDRPGAAIVCGILFGAQFTRAAYEHEIKKLKEDRDRAWRYFYEEKELRNK